MGKSLMIFDFDFKDASMKDGRKGLLVWIDPGWE
jgi:hypothetical protein